MNTTPVSFHVVPHEGGWEVKKSNDNDRIYFRTKKEAVDAGRKMSRSAKGEFVIHGKDGKIQVKNSHGNDPRSSKG